MISDCGACAGYSRPGPGDVDGSRCHAARREAPLHRGQCDCTRRESFIESRSYPGRNPRCHGNHGCHRRVSGKTLLAE